MRRHVEHCRFIEHGGKPPPEMLQRCAEATSALTATVMTVAIWVRLIDRGR